MSVLVLALALSFPQVSAPLPVERPDLANPDMAPTESPGEALAMGGAGRELFGAMPLAFVENRGQRPTVAEFVAQRGPMVARLQRDGLVIQLREGERALVLRLAFEGASEEVLIEGEDRQPGFRNYFLGSAPEAWRTQVPSYSSVLYRGLHDGVDVRVRDQKGRLEYDLLLAPDSDLGQVVVRCEGAEGLALEADGSLVLSTAFGPVRQTPPATWYVLPSGDREPVHCRFVVLDESRYGFEIPDRDASLPVVIDPGIEWSTFLGGSASDQIFGLAVDQTGVITVAGRSRSSDFPVTDGTSLGGTDDAFVARLDPARPAPAQLLWATYFGGSDRDRSLRLAEDAAGGIYITGQTASADFPTTPQAYESNLSGDYDAFVAKLDATGGALLYSTYLGGTLFDAGATLDLRGPDEVAVGGTTNSPDFPTTAGAFDTTPNGSLDAFVSVLRLDGTGPDDLYYSTYLGGGGIEGHPNHEGLPGLTRIGIDLAVDGSGDIFVTGRTASADFPTTPSAYDTTHNGAVDAYVAQLRPEGNGSADLVYSTFVGSSEVDEGQAIALESATAVVVAGKTLSEGFPTTPNAYDTTFNGVNGVESDGFLFRLDTARQGLDQLQYSTLFGGAVSNPVAGAGEGVSDLVLDGLGGWIVVGLTAASPGTLANTFPTTCAAYDTEYNDFVDGFVFHLDPAGNGPQDLLYSTFVGESGWDTLGCVALASQGPPVQIVVAGFSLSASFPTTPNAYDPSHNGSYDGVVLLMELTPQWSTYCSTAPNSVGPGALIAGSCNVGIADNSFELSATGAIPNQFGLFYYGPDQQQAPFGDGFQCVAPGAIGVFRLNPPLVIDGSGAASRLVDFTQPPANAGPGQITAGSTWNFQFWYRDPTGPGGTTFNLSDALSVTFTP